MKSGDCLDGRYRILRMLGAGGEGSVFLAVQERIYKFYAVKVMEKKEEYFSKESVELWKRLSHPGLPGIVDILELETKVCVVMEYVEGKNLAEILDQQGLPGERRVISWAIQICEILEYLHRQEPPVVFGDVKLANLILQKDRIVMVDLGSALQKNSRGRRSGTPGYQPPEKTEESGQNRELFLDLYALGKCMEFLAFGGERRRGERGRRERDGISGEFKKILDKCTAQKESERYGSVKECRMDLEKLQRRPWMLSIMVVCTLCVMAVAGETLERDQSAVTAAQQYEQLLWDARNSPAKTQRELLKEAIAIDPSCENGYLDLLENLLEDSCLSEEEDEILRKTLMQSDGDGVSFETRLQENPQGYGAVAYEIGMAYLYFYEGEGGKNYGVSWFQKVLQLPEGGQLEESKKKRCRLYEKIGSYRLELEHGDRTGESGISFGVYWKDLMELFETMDGDRENAALTLYFWQELLVQMMHYKLEFQEAGVTDEEMKNVVNLIEKGTEEMVDLNKAVRERKEQIQNLLKEAKEDVG